MRQLAAGLDYFDLNFQGQSAIIASAILHGRQGVAIIDPGPSTTLAALRAGLATRGFTPRDVRAILLTHIHLDHAGATGTLLDECPDAEVFVHERGARHLVDPSKLLVSAGRLYGDEMQTLWGEVRAVPAGRLRTLGDSDRLSIVGHDVESTWTPGHASHHVSFFLPSARLAFVGDTGGICRPTGRLVLPPTPPPDIDLDAWRASTDRILAWNPDVIFLTHFGPQQSPRVHFNDLWTRMDDWVRKVRALLAKPGTDEERSRLFVDDIVAEIQRSASREEALAYARAGRFDFSFAGIARFLQR